MSATILTVPGYRGSDEQHWQSWLERQLPQDVVRLEGINWDNPVLSDWAGQIRKVLQKAGQPVWIVAHSFGCLAAAVAVADQPGQTAGVIFVAPADTARFTALGCRDMNDPHTSWLNNCITDVVPFDSLQVPGLLIASRNDPWLQFNKARDYAGNWALEFLDIGEAGHINTASGFGDWPLVLELLLKMRSEFALSPGLHSDSRAHDSRMRAGRGSALAKVRQKTRHQLARLLLLSSRPS